MRRKCGSTQVPGLLRPVQLQQQASGLNAGRGVTRKSRQDRGPARQRALRLAGQTTRFQPRQAHVTRTVIGEACDLLPADADRAIHLPQLGQGPGVAVQHRLLAMPVRVQSLELFQSLQRPSLLQQRPGQSLRAIRRFRPPTGKLGKGTFGRLPALQPHMATRHTAQTPRVLGRQLRHPLPVSNCRFEPPLCLSQPRKPQVNRQRLGIMLERMPVRCFGLAQTTQFEQGPGMPLLRRPVTGSPRAHPSPLSFGLRPVAARGRDARPGLQCGNTIGKPAGQFCGDFRRLLQTAPGQTGLDPFQQRPGIGLIRLHGLGHVRAGSGPVTGSIRGAARF